MKTLVLAIAAVFAMSTSAFAQDENSQNTKREHKQFSQTEMIEMQTNRMVKQLGLDDTQKAALLKLNTEYAGKMGRGMGPGPRGQFGHRNDSTQQERPTEAQMEEMRAKMKEERKQMEESRTAYNAELKKLLTDEQYTKYETMEKQMRQRGGMRGGRGQGGPRMERRNNQDSQDIQDSQENQAIQTPEE